MSDTYGAIDVPLVASSTAGSDPLLANLLAYFKAVAAAYAINEWNAIAPGYRSPNVPVFGTFEHDPDETSFSDAVLPALFLWRSKVTDRVWVAQDHRVEFGELTLLWVPPPADQNRTRIRADFVFKLLKVLDLYLERMRDPAWVVPGDPDGTASTRGSFLPTFAGFRRLHFAAAQPRPLIINVKGTRAMNYMAYAATLAVEEEIAPDISRYDLLDGLDATLTTPATDPDDPAPQSDPLTLVTGDF